VSVSALERITFLDEGMRSLGEYAGELVRVGKRPTNDLVISHQTLSASHAVVAFRDGGFWLTDLGSANGTFVNGTKIRSGEPRRLAAGDQIKLGAVVLTVRFSTAES
jgi:pSer/pThr/pTyr-binding forkhead associated (FHA) protein